jgi:hypothetical protein
MSHHACHSSWQPKKRGKYQAPNQNTNLNDGNSAARENRISVMRLVPRRNLCDIESLSWTRQDSMRHTRNKCPEQLATTWCTPRTDPGPSLCASLWRSLSRSRPALHPAEHLALPPDPSLIPVPAEAVTWYVRVVRPTLSHALIQRSAAELSQLCDSPSHCAPA